MALSKHILETEVTSKVTNLSFITQLWILPRDTVTQFQPLSPEAFKKTAAMAVNVEQG